MTVCLQVFAAVEAQSRLLALFAWQWVLVCPTGTMQSTRDGVLGLKLGSGRSLFLRSEGSFGLAQSALESRCQETRAVRDPKPGRSMKRCLFSRGHFPILSRDPSFQKTIRTP